MGDPIVTESLKSLGIAGAIISVLMATCGGLITAILVMYRHGNKVYSYRLKERDILNKALTSAAEATRDHTRTMADRNDALRELATAIKDQSAAFERLHDRVHLQYEFMSEELKRHAIVIQAIAEADRTLAGLITDSRNAAIGARNISDETKTSLLNLITVVGEIKLLLATLATPSHAKARRREPQ